MQIQHQGLEVVTYMFVTGIKIFDQTIYVFPSKVLDRLIYSGSKIKLALNIIDLLIFAGSKATFILSSALK